MMKLFYFSLLETGVEARRQRQRPKKTDEKIRSYGPTNLGRATLEIGDIPVVNRDPFDDGPLAMTIAEFYASIPVMTAGTVTITSFDSSVIAGTFTATGPDSSVPPSSTTTFSGSFDAPICPSR